MVYSPTDLNQVKENTSTTSTKDKITYAVATAAILILK